MRRVDAETGEVSKCPRVIIEVRRVLLDEPMQRIVETEDRYIREYYRGLNAMGEPNWHETDLGTEINMMLAIVGPIDEPITLWHDKGKFYKERPEVEDNA